MVAHELSPSPGLAEPSPAYILVRLHQGTNKDSVHGVYKTEDQAYAAAIHNLIHDMEAVEGCRLPKKKAIAVSETLMLKERLQTVLAMQSPEKPGDDGDTDTSGDEEFGGDGDGDVDDKMEILEELLALSAKESWD
ncbi:hypothetical protein AMTR_s00070p00165510 [Amborella trichopoda]|uniref:Uncharacterized protein n=1 Tax=Amborella trichopoda TaxID=13333 RepID=U5DEL7_AMBTC|nr:hypothetical protein AMTR_s00070p00165510 [Amborella trichopoda]